MDSQRHVGFPIESIRRREQIQGVGRDDIDAAVRHSRESPGRDLLNFVLAEPHFLHARESLKGAVDQPVQPVVKEQLDRDSHSRLPRLENSPGGRSVRWFSVSEEDFKVGEPRQNLRRQHFQAVWMRSTAPVLRPGVPAATPTHGLRSPQVQGVDRRQMRVDGLATVVHPGQRDERVADLRRTVADAFLDRQLRGGRLSQGVSCPLFRWIDRNGQNLSRGLYVVVVEYGNLDGGTGCARVEPQRSAAASVVVRPIGVVGVGVVVTADLVAHFQRRIGCRIYRDVQHDRFTLGSRGRPGSELHRGEGQRLHDCRKALLDRHAAGVASGNRDRCVSIGHCDYRDSAARQGYGRHALVAGRHIVCQRVPIGIAEVPGHVDPDRVSREELLVRDLTGCDRRVVGVGIGVRGATAARPDEQAARHESGGTRARAAMRGSRCHRQCCDVKSSFRLQRGPFRLPWLFLGPTCIANANNQ